MEALIEAMLLTAIETFVVVTRSANPVRDSSLPGQGGSAALARLSADGYQSVADPLPTYSKRTG